MNDDCVSIRLIFFFTEVFYPSVIYFMLYFEQSIVINLCEILYDVSTNHVEV